MTIEEREEGKRTVVDYCFQVFEEAYQERMAANFAELVTEWSDETLECWLRWGVDEHTAYRIWREIQEQAARREEIHDLTDYDS